MITKERAAHLCSILSAMAEGKTVQVNLMGRWVDRDTYPQDITTFQPGVDYRVKPEPRKTYYRLWESELRKVCVSNVTEAYYKEETRRRVEGHSSFTRWLGDWQEHVVTE